MAKPYKLSESEIPTRRTNSLYADIVADFIAQGTASMQVTIEGMKPTDPTGWAATGAQGRRGREAGAEGREDVPGTPGQRVGPSLAVRPWLS